MIGGADTLCALVRDISWQRPAAEHRKAVLADVAAQARMWCSSYRCSLPFQGGKWTLAGLLN